MTNLSPEQFIAGAIVAGCNSRPESPIVGADFDSAEQLSDRSNGWAFIGAIVAGAMNRRSICHYIMQIYANLFKITEKCYISSISQRSLIMFVLSDRAGWGLQNFYTELWNSLIMHIYAIFFKINGKCYISWFSSISQRILTLFVLSDRAGWGFKTSTLNCEIH